MNHPCPYKHCDMLIGASHEEIKEHCRVWHGRLPRGYRKPKPPVLVQSPPVASWEERCKATAERLGCNLSGRLNQVQCLANAGKDKDAREELLAILRFFRGAYVRHVQRYRRGKAKQ